MRGENEGNCFLPQDRRIVGSMKNIYRVVDIALIGGLLMGVAAPLIAATAPNLGAAAGYTIIDINTPNVQVRSDAQRVYNELFASPCAADLTHQDLNNQRLIPGVYCINENTTLNGQVIFDARGDANAVFVVRFNGAFSVAANAAHILTGGAEPRNIFWAVNGPLSFGVNAQVAGTFIAVGSVAAGYSGGGSAFDERGTVNGRLISLNDRVTVAPRVTVGFIAPPSASITPPFLYVSPSVVTSPILTGMVTVINTDSNFVVFVDGLRVESGEPASLVPGTHTVSEVNISNAQYWMPVWGGDCAGNGLNGVVTVNAGEHKTCVVTNEVALPGLPNTGASGPYLMLLNLFGLALIGMFVWHERRFRLALS